MNGTPVLHTSLVHCMLAPRFGYRSPLYYPQTCMDKLSFFNRTSPFAMSPAPLIE